MIKTADLIKIIGEGKAISDTDSTIVITEDTKNVFSSNESISVIEAARIIAADGFGVDVNLQSLEGIKDHLINVSVCAFVCFNEVMGFASAKFSEGLDVSFYME